MQFNYRLGVIYDTLFYNVVYFNKNTILDIIRKNSLPEGNLFTYYDLLNKSKTLQPPPQSLYPFFYYDGDNPSPLSTYFVNHFDLFRVHFNLFINELKCDKGFKEAIISYYCSTLPHNVVESIIKGDPESISKAIAINSIHKEKLFTFVKLFYHFNELVEILINHLSNLYLYIERLHRKMRKSYDSIIFRILTEENKCVIKEVSNVSNNAELLQQVYSICFTAPYTFLYAVHKTKHPAFLFLVDTIVNFLKNYTFLKMSPHIMW